MEVDAAHAGRYVVKRVLDRRADPGLDERLVEFGGHGLIALADDGVDGLWE